ncbi:GNAT family N-acetyltransferase [Candidatus Williamhamiltonella defendens]|uniref:GNAT family N-acetyltransferase n=1 Tax=Candidatus Williamhamiltonella defendens TaxID=138072 RepID=UPI00130DA8A8|nr:GNAT family N-acetyltransferase [Candidatus Hamiltonella defensa]
MILLEITRAKQAGLDFISVSFGYERKLSDFWRACRFTVVRIGSHNDTCTGCCTLMAIFQFSPAGKLLYQAAQKQMIRDATD